MANYQGWTVEEIRDYLGKLNDLITSETSPLPKVQASRRRERAKLEAILEERARVSPARSGRFTLKESKFRRWCNACQRSFHSGDTEVAYHALSIHRGNDETTTMLCEPCLDELTAVLGRRIAP
jgi:Zn finger protein HypA/HybF involved in hydrogenase expression